jgi:hypothetical protein
VRHQHRPRLAKRSNGAGTGATEWSVSAFFLTSASRCLHSVASRHHRSSAPMTQALRRLRCLERSPRSSTTRPLKDAGTDLVPMATKAGRWNSVPPGDDRCWRGQDGGRDAPCGRRTRTSGWRRSQLRIGRRTSRRQPATNAKRSRSTIRSGSRCADGRTGQTGATIRSCDPRTSGAGRLGGFTGRPHATDGASVFPPTAR